MFNLESDFNINPSVNITIPFGAWHDEKELPLKFPAGWQIYNAPPDNGREISEAEIDAAFTKPIGTESLRVLAKGKETAAIAIDDITRPTPTYVFLQKIISELNAGGINSNKIQIIIGTAAHRPMNKDEMRKKLGDEAFKQFKPIMHDFMGPDVCYVGNIHNGPVYLNRHFLEADVKICVGCVMPHGETGFGGGAKMVVPGLSGRLTITYFHGALPARENGQLEGKKGVIDQRSWAEDVARRIGVDAVICAVVNSKSKLAGLFVGDVVEAHRAAAQRALEIGHTTVRRQLARQTDIVVVNTYPLDTDPIQMGKALTVAKKLNPKIVVLVNAASDGIFYHGMGMGSGFDLTRLCRNIPGFLSSAVNLRTWAKSMCTAIRRPYEIARLCYFSLNHLSYKNFEKYYKGRNADLSINMVSETKSKMFLFSKLFPAWGFHQRYPKGRLYRNWEKLTETLNKQYPKAIVVVLPCGPLQIVSLSD
jgi:nickel-dependent lactate racemase